MSKRPACPEHGVPMFYEMRPDWWRCPAACPIRVFDEDRQEWARRALAALIGEQVAKLEAHRETLDLEAIAADREGASSRALFDPSKEATLARKYEAAAVRELHRTLKELRAIEVEAARRAVEAPMPARAPVSAPPLGSFSTGGAARQFSPAPTPSAVPEAPRIGVSGGSSYIPFAVGRAPSGSA